MHGLWLHSSSWDPWVEHFGGQGYSATAPPWPGEPATVEESRNNPDAVAGRGIDDVVGHYARAIAELGQTPIVVGHSFGGLITQRLLAEGHAAAGVAIDPAPIKGILYLPPWALRVASIALRNPANRHRAVSLTREQFRHGFRNAVPRRSRTSSTAGGRFPRPASRSSRRRPPTSRRALLRRSTRRRRSAGRFSSPRAAGPHRARRRLEVDAQGLPRVERRHGSARVPRPGPLAHDRQGLARDRRRVLAWLNERSL